MSETYQRSSDVLSENRDDTKYYSRYYPRRLMAEVLHDAITDVTVTPAVFDKVALNDGSFQETKFYEEGTRALELYDSAVKSYFLKTFGRNERQITCECERSNQPSMIQVLHLANGDTLNDKLSKKDGVIDGMLKAGMSDAGLIETAYLKALSRKPNKAELEAILELMKVPNPEEKRIAMEDLFWGLMTSREFLFQH